MPARPSNIAAAPLAIGLAVVTVAWAVAVPMTPVLAARGGWPSAGAAGAYAAGSLVCHQRPERSFVSSGRRWPVCARCAGIYLAAGAMTVVLAGAGRGRRRLAKWRRLDWQNAVVLALAPVGLTWALERVGLVAFSNAMRAATGLPLGAVVAAVVAANLPAPHDTRKT